MKVLVGLAALALAAGTASACSTHASAPTAPSLSQARATAAQQSSASSSPSATSTTDTTEPEAITQLTAFTSPSGNVGCTIDPSYVRCDISERNWSPPPRPADCEFDYGQGIGMSQGEPASFVCAGDTALGGGGPLPYGKSITKGALTCDSAEVGITCRDDATKHGFTISREAYRVF